MRRVPPLAWRMMLVGIVATGALHASRFRVVVDDAFISLRVARHWMEHGVPEYNAGIREWVPTSPLWVASLAGAGHVAPAALPVVAQVLGALAGAATLVTLALAAPGAGAAGAIAALLCAGSALWAAWPLSGMETSAFALMVLVCVLCLLRAIEPGAHAREAFRAGLAAGAAIALRPDGALALAVGLGTLALATGPAGRPGLPPRIGRMARFVAGWAIVALPVAGYLWATFGTVLPVSYYAKLNGLGNLGHGLAYLGRTALSAQLAFVAPVALVALAHRDLRRPAIVSLAAIAAWAAAIAIEGGDFMAYSRFVAPVWPLVCLVVALGIVGIARALGERVRIARAVAVAIAALVLAAWATPGWRGPDHDAYTRGARDELAREAIGTWLAGRYPDSEWVAVKPAGIIPFYSRMRAIDLFCITDLEAARTGSWVPDAWPGHQRANPKRVHDVAPRLAILEARLYPLAELPPPGMTDPNHGAGWLADPRAAQYEPARAEVLPGLWLDLFIRR